MLRNQDHITLVIPEPLEQWFKRKQSVLSGKVEAVAFRVPNEKTLADIWSDFSSDWTNTNALRVLSPSSQANPPHLIKTFGGSPSSRHLTLHSISFQTCGSRLTNERWRISRETSEFNPRFMGWRIHDPSRARESVIHAALAYKHSAIK